MDAKEDSYTSLIPAHIAQGFDPGLTSVQKLCAYAAHLQSTNHADYQQFLRLMYSKQPPIMSRNHRLSVYYHRNRLLADNGDDEDGLDEYAYTAHTPRMGNAVFIVYRPGNIRSNQTNGRKRKMVAGMATTAEAILPPRHVPTIEERVKWMEIALANQDRQIAYLYGRLADVRQQQQCQHQQASPPPVIQRPFAPLALRQQQSKSAPL
jgi:hypothetical protein